MNLNNVTIGSDPELFIYNKKKKKIISSIGLLPGVKGEAYTEGLPEGFGLQIDNILGEFNIPPQILYADGAKQQFIKNMEFMKQWISDYVVDKNKNLTILCAASAMVDEDQLQSDEAKEFGCSPDYNAYTQSVNPAPKGTETNLRTTGCHIHVGYDHPDVETSLMLVKYLDMYLGVPSVLVDKDVERRKLYGKAGCFRLTDYGVEYRVVSGYFISTPEIMGWMFDQVQKAVEQCEFGGMMAHSEIVQQVINTGDVKEATKICQAYSICKIPTV